MRLSSLLRLLPLTLLALGPTLSGCEDVRDTLGFNHATPDEFAVATNPPLSIPPDYALRPPVPGAAPREAVPASAQAQAALLGDNVSDTATTATNNSPNVSQGEAALLTAAGAAPVTTATMAASTPGTPQISPEQQKLETVLFGTPTAAANGAPQITLAQDSTFGGLF